MSEDSTFNKKYCCHCGNLIQSYAHQCPYCLGQVKYSDKEKTRVCHYCRKPIFSGAKYCEYCSTKVKRRDDIDDKTQLDLAFDKFEKEVLLQKNAKIKHNMFKTVNYYGGINQFEGQKRIGLRCTPEGITIQTLNMGQLEIAIDDFLVCYELTKSQAKDLLDFDIDDNKITDFNQERYYIIETKSGFITIDNSIESEQLIKVLYNNLNDVVCEFEYGFLNANHDEIFGKIENMIAKQKE